ncbi:MAG: hypothetical protein ABWK01_04910 [Infirmifilum sp.]
MVEIEIKGELHKRVKNGRKVYRGFFVIIVDGKVQMNLGMRNAQGNFDGNKKISFNRTVSIVGKAGPSGLEGSGPDGGKWFVLHLAPSDSRRKIAVKLPIFEDESLRLEITGSFDISGLDLCSSCDYTQILELEKPLEA